MELAELWLGDWRWPSRALDGKRLSFGASVRAAVDRCSSLMGQGRRMMEDGLDGTVVR